jgi:hypothetical protein
VEAHKQSAWTSRHCLLHTRFSNQQQQQQQRWVLLTGA